MKKWLLLIALLAGGSAYAGVEAGPRGGRLLELESVRAEFLVNDAKRIEIRFYDGSGTVTAPGERAVNAIADASTGKTKLEFQQDGDALVSTTALPEGDGYIVVVQIRASAEARPRNFRIPLHLERCGECNRAEYACTCEHAGDDHGHAH